MSITGLNAYTAAPTFAATARKQPLVKPHFGSFAPDPDPFEVKRNGDVDEFTRYGAENADAKAARYFAYHREELTQWMQEPLFTDSQSAFRVIDLLKFCSLDRSPYYTFSNAFFVFDDDKTKAQEALLAEKKSCVDQILKLYAHGLINGQRHGSPPSVLGHIVLAQLGNLPQEVKTPEKPEPEGRIRRWLSSRAPTPKPPSSDRVLRQRVDAKIADWKARAENAKQASIDARFNEKRPQIDALLRKTLFTQTNGQPYTGLDLLLDTIGYQQTWNAVLRHFEQSQQPAVEALLKEFKKAGLIDTTDMTVGGITGTMAQIDPGADYLVLKDIGHKALQTYANEAYTQRWSDRNNRYSDVADGRSKIYAASVKARYGGGGLLHDLFGL